LSKQCASNCTAYGTWSDGTPVQAALYLEHKSIGQKYEWNKLEALLADAIAENAEAKNILAKMGCDVDPLSAVDNNATTGTCVTSAGLGLTRRAANAFSTWDATNATAKALVTAQGEWQVAAQPYAGEGQVKSFLADAHTGQVQGDAITADTKLGKFQSVEGVKGSPNDAWLWYVKAALLTDATKVFYTYYTTDSYTAVQVKSGDEAKHCKDQNKTATSGGDESTNSATTNKCKAACTA
jgi:hypothetical protein